MELVLAIVMVVIIGVLVGFTVDRIQVGGDGIWYGSTEPPEGFVGFWDHGETVVQWPSPVADGQTIEELIEDSLKENANGNL